jgi:hypothetical protein
MAGSLVIFVLVIAMSEATRPSNPETKPGPGLLRGACHRARIRATRWLAITIVKYAADRFHAIISGANLIPPGAVRMRIVAVGPRANVVLATPRADTFARAS